MSAGSEFRDWANDLQREAKRAVKTAVGTATEGAKLELRAAIITASTARAGNMIGAEVFPRGDSINAAGEVYARGDLAAAILEAMQTGPVIRGDPYLAIPLAAAAGIRGRAGARGGFRFGMRDLIARFGKANVRSVPLKGRAGSLLVLARAGRFGGKASPWVPYFILVPRVKFPKLLHTDAVAERWSALVPALIARTLNGA